MITTKNNKFLLDCGNGITRNLVLPDDLESLTIIISHLHRDHYGDIFSLAYATYVYHNLGILKERIKVYIPSTKKESLDYQLLTNLGEEHYLKIEEYKEDSEITLRTDNAGIDTTVQDGATIRDVFSDPMHTTAEEVITKEPLWQLPNLDIIASHIRLTATELQLVATAGRERILQKWIDRNRGVLERYDYIIIDTNPSMGIVNQNAFMAADEIVLVSDVSKKAIQGAQLFAYLWGEICENLEIEDKTSALIINRCDMRLNATKNIIEYYNDDEDFSQIVLNNTIPARVDVMNTETMYLPINFTAPNS